jgi:hypothetical protein
MSSPMSPLAALRRLAERDTCPSLAEVLEVGRELHGAGLSYEPRNIITGPERPARIAFHLLRSASARHRGGTPKGTGDSFAVHVQALLDQVRCHGEWPHVRNELGKFLAAVQPPRPPQTCPWPEKDLYNLQRIPRLLLLYMLDRERAHLDELAPQVWGEAAADLKPGAVPMALNKVNHFLATRNYPRSLEKVRDEPELRWS